MHRSDTLYRLESGDATLVHEQIERNEWTVLDIPKAVAELNRRAAAGERVAGMLHLTC